MLDIQLLGDLTIVYNNQPVTELDSPRLRSLLAYLLLHRDAPQLRQQLAFLLSPDSTEARAQANLRTLLFRLRQVLPGADRFLQIENRTIQWRSDSPFTLDVQAFEKSIAQAKAESTRSELQNAVTLYHGDLLPTCYEDWILPERERLRGEFIDVLERLTALLENQRNYRLAIQYAERLLQADPLREESYRWLMRLHALGGDRAGARRVYQTCIAVLERELGVEPGPETRAEFARLYQSDKPEISLPVGTVTLLFTDIESSTRLLQRLGDRYAGVLETQQQLLRAVFERHQGRVVDTQGDSLFVAFSRAADAVAAAVEAQRTLARHAWGEGIVVRVRMGLHTGEPKRAGVGYVGLDVHRAARIGAAGHGGQILLSQTARDLVANELPAGAWLKDLGEHRLKDLEAERLYQIVTPDLPADFPPLVTLDAFPHNLPLQLTSFIGWERELTELKWLLGKSRLLTLAGPGGSGKTRLAIQLAVSVPDAFSNGIWFVDLSPLSDPALVPSAIASALGVSEQPGRALLDSLLDYVSSKELLLILDNCEHVLDTCTPLVEKFLRHCTRLQVVATSRERLGLAGESVWSVPPLSLPPTGPADRLTLVRESEAVRLFVERAVSILPTFGLNAQNAPSVAQICRRLEGIPLAIELAAARVRVLTPTQIAARLDDALRLLARGDVSAPPRQQTMRATLDWSYTLLLRSEQTLFRRLSVFSGGFTLEAAERVCSEVERSVAEPLAPADVLDLLSELMDRSLVTVMEWQEAEQVRYRLLEPVRQYALDMLGQANEMNLVRDRHLEYFRSLAEQAEPHFKSKDQLLWLDRLDTEHDNLRAALAWAQAGGSVQLGLRLAAALRRFWVYRAYLGEGHEVLENLLAKPEAASNLPVYAEALLVAGILADLHLDGDASRRHLEQSEKLWLQLGVAGKQGLAYARINLIGSNSGGPSDFPAIRRLYQENLKLFQEVNDDWGVAHTLRLIGMAAHQEGDLQGARRALESSYALFQAIGDRMRAHGTLATLGELSFREGRFAEARMQIEQALDYYRQSRYRIDSAPALWMLGVIAIREANYEAARAAYTECMRFEQEINKVYLLPECLIGLAAIAQVEKHFVRAVQLLAAAKALVEAPSRRRSGFEDWDRIEYDRLVNLLRAQVEHAAFETAWAKGRAMHNDEAIQYALAAGGR
jgi:predicted ATPase/DNA-binding SARP family transcriptional activator